MNKVIVTLEGGVVQDVMFEDCKDIIEVEIRDFDTDGSEEENLSKNEEGEEYLSFTYSNEADKLGLDTFPKLTGNE